MYGMKDIYVCGPVTGRPWIEAAEHFDANERRIIATAFENKIKIAVSNPTSFCQPDLEWHRAIRRCTKELLDCHGIALLQGWQFSRGAKLELSLAQNLKIPVVYIEPPAAPGDLTKIFIAAPETLRYYNARLAQFQKEGVEESLAEERAAVELANRYLDPYGFEYIDSREE
jgi:hypothetical protein